MTRCEDFTHELKTVLSVRRGLSHLLKVHPEPPSGETRMSESKSGSGVQPLACLLILRMEHDARCRRTESLPGVLADRKEIREQVDCLFRSLTRLVRHEDRARVVELGFLALGSRDREMDSAAFALVGVFDVNFDPAQLQGLRAIELKCGARFEQRQPPKL